MSRTARSGRTIRRTRTSFRNGRTHLVSSLASGELRCSTHVRPLVRSNKLDRSQLHRQQLHRLLHRNPFDPQPAAVCGADATLEVAPASAYLGGGAAAIWTHAGAMPILGPMRRRCRYLDVLVLGNPGGTLALPHTKLFIEIINLWGIRGPAAGTPALPIGARRRPAQPDLEFPRTTAPPATVPKQPGRAAYTYAAATTNSASNRLLPVQSTASEGATEDARATGSHAVSFHTGQAESKAFFYL